VPLYQGPEGGFVARAHLREQLIVVGCGSPGPARGRLAATEC
jgi:hypothetical protein